MVNITIVYISHLSCKNGSFQNIESLHNLRTTESDLELMENVTTPLSPSTCLKDILLSVRAHILAHGIGISDILYWDSKSYLTHAILPRLSHEGCTHSHGSQVMSLLCLNDVIMSCRASRRIQELLGVFFKHKMRNLMVSKKKNPLFVRGWDLKIRPSRSPLILGTDFSILPSHS